MISLDCCLLQYLAFLKGRFCEQMCNLSFFLRSSQCAALVEAKLINQPIKYFHYLSPQRDRVSGQNNGRGTTFKRCFSCRPPKVLHNTSQHLVTSLAVAADTVYTNAPEVWAQLSCSKSLT